MQLNNLFAAVIAVLSTLLLVQAIPAPGPKDLYDGDGEVPGECSGR